MKVVVRGRNEGEGERERVGGRGKDGGQERVKERESPFLYVQ